jgi:hypothetical protein
MPRAISGFADLLGHDRTERDEHEEDEQLLHRDLRRTGVSRT